MEWITQDYLPIIHIGRYIQSVHRNTDNVDDKELYAAQESLNSKIADSYKAGYEIWKSKIQDNYDLVINRIVNELTGYGHAHSEKARA